MADFPERLSFADRWMDLLPASTNIEDRRNEPYNPGVSLYRGRDSSGEPLQKPWPPATSTGAQGLLGPLLSMWGFVPRDDAASLASRKERASKIRDAYKGFFDTPGQKDAMANPSGYMGLPQGDSKGSPWWLDMAKQLGGTPPTAMPASPAAPAEPVPTPLPRPPMSLEPPNPGPSAGAGVVPPMRMASMSGIPNYNPDLPNMVDPTQLPQQGLHARTVMDPNTGGMMNDFATRSPGGDISSLFRSLIGK